MASTYNRFDILKKVSNSDESAKDIEGKNKELLQKAIEKKNKAKKYKEKAKIKKKKEKRSGLLLKFQEPKDVEQYKALFGDAKVTYQLSHEEYLKKMRRKILQMKDIRDLIYYLRAQGDQVPWMHINNSPAIPLVNLLFIDGLSRSFYLEHCDSMSFLPKQTCVRLLGAGRGERAFPAAYSLLVSMARTKKKRKAKMAPSFEKKELADIVMTQKELRENDYITTLEVVKEDGFHWIRTGESNSSSSREESGVFALDCEMCMTEHGLELARATLLDYSTGDAVYDKIVKPTHEVTNYLTMYSGITQEMLENVDTTLEDVQKDFLAFIDSNTILIGHSLENDLKCLKMVHTRIIDTSVLFPRADHRYLFDDRNEVPQRQFKYSLKKLAKQILDRNIQSGEHDSLEDARACADIVRKKLVEWEDTFISNNEYTLEKIQSTGYSTLLIDKSDNLRMLAPSEEVEKVAVENDVDLFRQLEERVDDPKYDFLCGHSTSLTDTLNDTDSVTSSEGGIAAMDSDDIDNSTDGSAVEKGLLLEMGVANIDERIATLAKKAAPNTFFIVVGIGNIAEIQKIQKYKVENRDSWSNSDANRLLNLSTAAKDGICFVFVA